MKNQGMDPGLAAILESTPAMELDYRFVMHCLEKSYQRPDMKLAHLVEVGALVRVKKGLYVVGDRVAKHPHSKEVLANKIYGPSYVSLEWALQHYRMIPERVVEITSVTSKRSTLFETPIGRFSYRHIKPHAFSVGVDLLRQGPFQSALIATREKAVADLLVTRRGRTTSRKMMREILFEDLRFESEDLVTLNLDLLDQIQAVYRHSAIAHLIAVIREERE